MKFLGYFAFLFCLVANPIFAQDSEPRTSMSIMKFKIKDKNAAKNKRIYTQDGLGIYKEISLNNTSTRLNLIEENLLAKYADVVVNKLHRQYFIFDENEHIGIANIYGKELVPPITGKVRYFGMYMLFGETTDDFELIDNEYTKLISKNSSYDVGFSLGLCKAVIKNTKNNDLEVIIPYGRYDCISVIPKSIQLQPRGFYVGKIDGKGNVLWGACDENGKEIIECKYRSVYFDGNRFQGNENKDMSAWNDYYAQQIGLKQELQSQRKQKWAVALNSIGNSMIGMLESDENSSNSSNSHVGKYSNEEKSVGGLNARNTAYKAYEGYANELSKMKFGITEYDDNLRKEYQSKMRDIRIKWENSGYQFTKLEWENWDGVR